MHHSGAGVRVGSHYGGRHGSSSATLGAGKSPQIGDARYAAAQAAVAAALSHTSISSSSSVAQTVHNSSSAYGKYAPYHGPGVPSRGPSSPPTTSRHGRAPIGPGGGPPRYDPNNGDSSSAGVGGGFRGSGVGGGRAESNSGSLMQPRSLARPGGVAPHEFVSNRGGRPSGQSPVSTVPGRAYHNYAVPPTSMPLGGGVDVHYMPRSVSLSRGEDPRDRDGKGKSGHW